MSGGGDTEAGSTQLDFSQAMTDFKIMFPNMDVDVIEAVLRSNSGAVDATIDQLLTMTADNEGGDTALPSYREAVDHLDSATDLLGAASLQEAGQPGRGAEGGGAGVSLRRRRNWNPPLLGKLPPDFLRMRGAPKPTSHAQHAPSPGHAYTHPDRAPASSHAPASARAAVSERQQQMLEDEKFAMMLQNEEFMRELRGNQEFMTALEQDHGQDPPALPAAAADRDRPREAAGSSGRHRPHLPHMDDAVFREKLKNMGKTSKAKFSKLATMFSRGAGVGRAGKDNLLLGVDPPSLGAGHSTSRRQQLREESDSEDESHCTTKGRKYQLM